MKKFQNPFKYLTKFERGLWATSLFVVVISFLLPEEKDYLTLVASLIGVTALIFVAKGLVVGQILCVVFALFYGVISFFFGYYGEMITYAFMSAPMAIASTVSWLKNPHESANEDANEVKVGTPTARQLALVGLSTVAVTVVFYFVLKAFDTANLQVSTLSVATSFLAVSLTYLRSPFYACAYGANDVVLIVLWLLASARDVSYLPMVFCFLAFLANDVYGFVNWLKMKKRQEISYLEKE